MSSDVYMMMMVEYIIGSEPTMTPYDFKLWFLRLNIIVKNID